MAYLFSNPPVLGTTTVSMETEGSVDILLPKLVNGDIDIGVLPPNIAAKLYNLDTRSIQVCAVVGNCMLSLVTRDKEVHSLRDLAGKTVYMAGQGATPEYVFRALLAKNGLPANSVTLDFSIPAPEIAAAMAANRIAYALIPEPFATVAVMNGTSGRSPVRRALHIRDLWESAGYGTDFPMTLCVIRKGYAEKHPDTVHAFLAAYQDSVKRTIANPSESGKLVEDSGLGLKSQLASKAIPECNLVFISSADGRSSIEKLLSVFIDFSPESVGGKIPDEGFYFK